MYIYIFIFIYIYIYIYIHIYIFIYTVHIRIPFPIPVPMKQGRLSPWLDAETDRKKRQSYDFEMKTETLIIINQLVSISFSENWVAPSTG